MVSDLCGETYLKVLYGGVFFFFFASSALSFIALWRPSIVTEALRK